ncbi:hypothetical protein HDU76_008363 [Blyttiomyces sp. JEL0837]|nr:hypothetical protein HDU76_008363 [Blyttiomyces sp. JEL0837]
MSDSHVPPPYCIHAMAVKGQVHIALTLAKKLNMPIKNIIMKACRFGILDLVQNAIVNNGRETGLDFDFTTALNEALKSNSPELVRLILSKFDQQAHPGYVEPYGNREVTRIVFEHFGHSFITKEYNNELLSAISTDDISKIKYLIELKTGDPSLQMNIKVLGESGKMGHIESLTFLLETLDENQERGITWYEPAFQQAVKTGNVPGIVKLMETGIWTNLLDQQKASYFIDACTGESDIVAIELFNAGVPKLWYSQACAFKTAISNGHLGVLRMLIPKLSEYEHVKVIEEGVIIESAKLPTDMFQAIVAVTGCDISELVEDCFSQAAKYNQVATLAYLLDFDAGSRNILGISGLYQLPPLQHHTAISSLLTFSSARIYC